MRKNRIVSFFIAGLLALQGFAQSVPSGYTVGTWSGFRKGAVSYTFDDGLSNQITVALPLFEKYGYKASFYLVTNWNPDWTGYQSAVNKGHEVGSHSDSHQNTMPDSEISSSKTNINNNITKQDCNTITYPNCNKPSETELAKYYISGRVCNGQLNQKSPQNYFEIGSILCGDNYNCKTYNDFKSEIDKAKNQGGWTVFLIHEVGNGSGHSPTSADAIDQSLKYISDNDADIWCATFRDVTMYAKERDALGMTETGSGSSLTLKPTTNLSSSVATFNYPVTVRREMPSGWTNFAAATGGADIAVTIVSSGGKKYAQFDVVPGKTYTLEDRASEFTGNGGEVAGNPTTTELITNGEFDDDDSGWNVENHESAKSTQTVVTTAGMSGEHAMQICPNGNSGTEEWHIQLYQPIALEAGKEYTVSFSAKAASSRSIVLMIQKMSADYDSYLWKQYNLTTTAQTFTENIVAPDDVASDVKITFCIGKANGCVFIDNVSVTTEEEDNGNGNGGSTGGGEVEVTGDIARYFIDKAYIGPSCDVIPGGEITDGAYYTGEYRNLFVEYLGKTEKQVQDKMQSIWNHFFEGNDNTKVYYEVGSDMAYIYDTGNGDVRTEGMSYGMMICVQMGDQTKFDKLWRWAKKYMQYPKGNQREGLFAWQCETNGTIKGASCAPDGEMYFLTALWFASHRWGNDGSINYEEEAQYLINQIYNKPGRGNGQVSPIFNRNNYLVTFGETSYDFTDPSYNLPGFLELWARWTNSNKTFWEKTPGAARDLLYKSAHQTTGLYPDYSQFDGSPYRPSWCGYESDIYKYDAIRCPMNVGMDYHWFAADSRQNTMMSNILNFFKKDNFSHGYFNVDGSNPDGGYSEGQKGANGVGVFGLVKNTSNNTLAKEYVQAMWNTTPPSGQWRYYNGMVYMLSMLHASGNFKIFKPTPEVVVENLSGPSPVVFNGVEYTESTSFKTLIDCKIYDVTITIEESVEIKHSVIFKDYDGTEIETVEVLDGEAATAPAEPTRTGYTFDGWDKDFSAVTEDLTVTATYTINTYTVTFVDYNGNVLDAQTVEYGSAATAPAEPTREGYTFDGWDKAFANITADLTVTATYVENAPVVTNKYEAEKATYAGGASVASSSKASGGKYVKMVEGSLSFNVNVASAGLYTVEFVYSLTEDYKAQTLKVNGSQVGSVAFNKSGSANPTFASVEVVVMLNAGANTIALEKSWGYVDIDYLTLTPAARTSFNIDAALATPNPSSSSVEVYDFLKENFGTKTISGVMTLNVLNGDETVPLISQEEVAYVKSKSSKTPAIVGFDFMHSTGLNSDNNWQKSYTKAIMSEAKELWAAGGIPTFSWHWRNPNKSDDSFDTKTTSFNLQNAFTNSSCTAWNTNSTEYKNIIADIDIVAAYLQEFQDEGMSILWRPIHEASGAWFWWGAKGATAYKQLYNLLFDRLVNHHNLNNLIWVWNSDGTDAEWYPGDAYVDVVGRDFYYNEGATYNHSSLVSDFEALAKQTAGKKLVTLAENGAIPYPENMANDDAIWSWFMPWYGNYVTSSDHNTAADWNSIMNDERVITLEDMPGWGKVVETFTVTFVDYDETVIGTPQTVKKGEDATAPAEPTREGYTFTGWDKEFTNVTANLTVTAQYEAKAKADYTALNAAIADAEALETEKYTEATRTALQTALTAAKAVDKDLYAENQSVIDDATTALRTAIDGLAVQTFTVTFVADDETVSTQTVAYGEDAIKPATDPTKEGYTFVGWDKEFTNVTANLTVTAQFTEKGKADYTALNAAIAEAEALGTEKYTEATLIALQTALTAAKAVDKDLYADSQSVIDDATTALRTAIDGLAVQKFTVTFVDYDDTPIGEPQTIEYGKDAVAPADPTREGYTFSGWIGAYENVKADVTIKAGYTEKGKADYTALNIAIADAEKILLAPEKYTLATIEAVQTALATAKAIAPDLYTESQPEIDAATKTLANAILALQVQTFTVTFVDYDDAPIGEPQIIEYGKDAVAPTDPTREGYTFSGWIGAYENVKADVTIKAGYVENGKADYTALDNAILQAEALNEAEYTPASWSAVQSALTTAKAVDRSLTEDKQSVVDAATTALEDALAALVAKTKADYTALNATIAEAEVLETEKYTEATRTALQNALTTAKAVDKDLYADNQSVIDDATTALRAAIDGLTVQKFTVTFVADGKTVSTQTVAYGEDATKPATDPTKEGYTFTGWDKEFTNVTANLTITAQFTENGKADYTALNIAIADAEKILLTPEKYTPATIGAVQTALAVAKAIAPDLYTESQPEIDAATKALTNAIIALQVQTFTVTFKADGATIGTQEVVYGQSAEAPVAPEKEGYEFVSWVGSFTNVTENTTIVAEYVAKSFVVTFVDYNNKVLDVQTVNYGKNAVAPASPTREGYTFTGWIGVYENVTANVTIKAGYAENGKADYTALDEAIATANALKEADYSNTSWAYLQNVLQSANTIDRTLYAESQSVVDNMTATLTSAIASLEKLDRTQLNTTIASANVLLTATSEGFNKGQYPIGSKEILRAAVVAAQSEYNRTSTTQSSIDKATADLQAAIDAYTEKQITADKMQLAYAISTAKAAIAKADGNTGSGQGQYPQSAVTILQTVITSAEDVYEWSNEQAVIDDKTQELNEAVKVFLASVNPILIDTSALAELVAEATDLLNSTSVGEKPGQYALLEYMELSRLKQTAQNIITKNTSTQKEVDETVVALREAIDAYKASQVPEPSAVSDVAAPAVVVYTKGHTIVVENAGESIFVFDVQGRVVETVTHNDAATVEIAIAKCGVYVVKADSVTQQVVIR